MNEVILSRSVLDAIARHGELAYPEECCGFLVGSSTDGPNPGGRVVRATRPVENRVAADRAHRFVIPPEELLRAQRELEGTPQEVLGFYHSHPDHPAVPSEFDREHAWPWYSYAVLSVSHGVAGELGVFELDPEERRFRTVRWTPAQDAASAEGRVTEGVISATRPKGGSPW